MINRSAIILIKKQPFLDWLKGLPDPVREELSLSELNEDATVYLLPDWNDDTERDELVREGYDVMFEQELEGWWTDESAWPKNRGLSVFRAWFDVRHHSMLVDLVDGPLEDDDA